MFTLLTPSALLALLGLLVPVGIYLWNRRPGREVPVGSLRWLAAGANRRLRNLKPEQLALLLLRAALLTVLALALAEPVWRQPQPAGRGQVLISPELAGRPALAALRPTIDSLRRRGYALRWLTTGFPKAPGTIWRADSGSRGDSARELAAAGRPTAVFHWARVQQAAGAFPGQPLYVLTPATLRGFAGPHPPLPTNVTWQILPAVTSESWLQAAALANDSLHLLVGNSTETQTVFRRIAVARPQRGGVVRIPGLAPRRWETGAAGPRLVAIKSPADSSRATDLPVPIRTQPLRVIIYATADYRADARSLGAALRAAAVGLPGPLTLALTTTPPVPTTTPPDWLFWLSGAPLPNAWRGAIRGGTNVWQAAAGPGSADTARLATTDREPAATIFRRAAPRPASAPDTTLPLWTDEQDQPVLTRQTLGQGAFYQLNTRLNPSWSTLADSPALPARLLALLQPEPTDENPPPATAQDQRLLRHDQRTLDPSQLYAAGQLVATNQRSLAGSSAAPAATRQTDLRPWLVLATGLLFAFERLLARRRDARPLPFTQ